MNADFLSFCKKYDIHLNSQQAQAVHAIDENVLLLAVPGSGKTTVLVARLGYMILEKHIDPEKILAITFNTQAAAEMKQRFSLKFGSVLANQISFKTINSLAYQIYSQFCFDVHYPKRNIDERREKAILRNVYQSITKEFPSENDILNLQSEITYVKNMRLDASQIKELEEDDSFFPKMFEMYEKVMKEQGLMDFNDQMAFAIWILENRKYYRDLWSDRYEYICVDEAQDTSKIQHDMIKILSFNNHLFMVGDEDQSIYGFRAAYPQALLSFQNDHDNAKVIRMETNYRSTPEIVLKAQAFISKNRDRFEKNMCADRPSGQDVKVRTVKDRRPQYAYMMKVLENVNTQTAVLYRENDSAVPLVDQLLRKNIPFFMAGAKTDVFGVPCIRDILAFMRLALDPYDTDAFDRVANKGYLFLKKQVKEQIILDCRTNAISVFEALDKFKEKVSMSNIEAFEAMINRLCYAKVKDAIWIASNDRYKKYAKDMNIDLTKLETLRYIAESETSISSFLNRIEYLRDVMRNGMYPKSSNIILSTVHASKGKEFDTVYLIDVYDGKFPAVQDNEEILCMSNQQLEQEERRLFYVALTRAKNNLNIIKLENRYSSFIQELFPKQEKKIQENSQPVKKIDPEEVERKRVEDFNLRKEEILPQIHQQEEPVFDHTGERWFQCEICKKVLPREYFSSYGGMNHMNLGVCLECRKSGKG